MKEFVIPGKHQEFKNSLELHLHNLEIRLRIQKQWVEETERQIEDVKERLKNG